MRFKVVAFLSIVLLASVCFSANKSKDKQFATPKSEDVAIYKNEVRALNEKPLYTAGTRSRLVVLDDHKDKYKVKNDADGQIGWIEKSQVVITGNTRAFVFDDAEVIGYLDNPTPIYIIDANDPNADPIKLDRSFADALRQNVDKETVERQVK